MDKSLPPDPAPPSDPQADACADYVNSLLDDATFCF